MDIRECLEEFLTDCEIRNYSKNTLKIYKVKIGKFVDYCMESDVDDVEDLRIVMVKKYTQYMLSRGMQASYVNSCLSAIKSFIQYCYVNEYGGFNTRNGKWVWCKEQKKQIATFTSKEMKEMLKNAKSNKNAFIRSRNYCLMCMAVDCGLRSMELRSIRFEDIKDGFIVIHGKGNKERVAVIGAELRKAMMQYERQRRKKVADRNVDDWYFVSSKFNQLSKSGIDYIVKAVGVNEESGARISPHTLRHFYAHESLKNGVGIFDISYSMGHYDVVITQRYLQGFRDTERLQMMSKNSVLKNLR